MKLGFFRNRKFTVLPAVVLLVVCTFAGITACNNEEGQRDGLPPLYVQDEDGSPEIEERIPVQSVEIEVESHIVERGSVIQPEITIYPLNATDQSYTLMTFDDTILRKSEDGFLAIESGTAEIIVSAADGVTNFVEIEVYVPVRRIAFEEDHLVVHLDRNLRLTPQITPEDAADTHMIFYSSNESIATVNSRGVVHGIAIGVADITAQSGNHRASVRVHVEVPADSITMSTDKDFYAVGERGTITVEFTPEYTTDQSFEVKFSRNAQMIDSNRFEVTGSGVITVTVKTRCGITEKRDITAVNLEILAEKVLELTNTERRLAGLQDFAQRGSLTLAANTRAQEIIRNFSSTRPNGRSFSTVLEQFNVANTVAEENRAMGQTTAAEAVKLWMGSQSDREKILDSKYRHLGIGIAIDADGTLYWIQLFIN